MNKRRFKIFQKYDTYRVFELRKKLLSKSLRNCDKDFSKDKLLQKFSLKPLEIEVDNMKRLRVADEKKKLLFYIYYVPFKGTPDLLLLNASDGINGWTLEVFANDHVLGFKKMTYLKSPEEYSEEIEIIKDVIEKEARKINNEVKNYNKDINRIIEMSLN